MNALAVPMSSNVSIASRSLRDLLAGTSVTLEKDVQITDLTLDSRAVRPGSAFVALQGTRAHGLQYAADAIARGASVVLWEPVAAVSVAGLDGRVPFVAVPNLPQVLGAIADRFFDAPSSVVRVLGVTGTNGKTTTAYLIAAALERLGHRAAYAGTIGTGQIGALRETTHTTPDCITVHRTLAELRSAQVRFLGMEVSSHALDQHRVGGVRFESAVFTNLTHDHLDYHGTLQAYGEAKAMLFRWPGLRTAIINVADEFGAQLAESTRGSAALTVYSRTPLPPDRFPHAAHYLFAQDVNCTPHGLRVALQSSWGSAELHAHFIGEFNVDNALAAIASLMACGVDFLEAVEALERCHAPPGRMQLVSAEGEPSVIVDYAHTPDALQKALLAARQHCIGRLLCVFGCGGDRDAAKRPVMGEIAERLADAVVVTDDNPRTEDGDAIVAAIIAGMRDPLRATVERDRRRAIERALAQAGPQDLVLIAGKGHEDYQIIGAHKRPFSDADVARELLGRDRP